MKYILLLVFVLTVTGPLFSAEAAVKQPVGKVCILYFETDFKKDLLTNLIADFNSRDYQVTFDTISNGSAYPAKDYGAVILLSSVQAFNPQPKTVEYINNNKYLSNIIYFSTYSMFNFAYGSLDKKKIDAITSASIINDSKAFLEVKNKILERTLKVLGKE